MEGTFWDHVRYIKNLIREGYNLGFPIIKELMQNANDANADVLIMGIVKEIKGIKHPLIKNSPALYIINNGKFTYSDAIAIRRISFSYKIDEFTIGRFGLGLKSLFNYCEAYFYLTDKVIINDFDKEKYEIKEEYKREIYLITPWENSNNSPEKNPYDSWWHYFKKDNYNEIKKDYNIIKEFVLKDIQKHNMKDWFVLWIPLRTKKAIKKEKDNYLLYYYWDEDFDKNENNLFNLENSFKIGEILPMMNTLNKVILKRSDNKIFEINRVEGEPLSLEKIKNNFNSKNFKIKIEHKEIELKNKNDYQEETFFIKTTLLHKTFENEFIKKLIDEQTKSDSSKNLIPHCGILISKNKEIDNNKVNFQYSTFLPLSNGHQQNNCKYNIFLHGFFYVDSKRTKIEFNIGNNISKDIKDEITWNNYLKKEASKLLIDALESFNEKYNINNEDIGIIIKFLKENIISENEKDKLSINDICSNNYWINRIYINESKWEKIPKSRSFYKIPKFNYRELKNNKTIKNFLEKYICVAKEKFYGLNDKKPEKWSEIMYSEWLKIEFTELFENDELFNLWVEVIKLGKDDIQEKLINYTKQNFINNDLNTLKDYSDKIEKILSILDKDSKVFLNIPDKYYQVLLKVDIKPIILIEKFSEKNEKYGNLSVEDAKKLIEKIIDLKIDDNKISNMALSIIKTVKEENREDFFKLIKDYNLFLVSKNYVKQILVSYSFLKEKGNNGFLFCHDKKLDKIFFEALSNQNISFIEKKIARDLSLNPPKCEKADIIDFINKKIPDLSTIEKRGNLIKAIKQDSINWEDKTKKVVRYLLHSDKSKFGDLETELYVDSNDIWGKLLKAILKSENKEWTILSKEQTQDLSYNDKENLKIINVIQNIVENYLRYFNNIGNIDLNSFTDIERQEIIRKFEDKETLKKLAIFKDTDNKLVPIGENTFLKTSEFDIPEEIKKNLTFLEDSQEITRLLEKEDLCKPISPNDFLKRLLDTENPGMYWELIKENLLDVEKKEDIDDKLNKKFKEKKWIPLKDSKEFVSLNSIIYIKGLEDVISKINDGSFDDYKMLDETIKETKIWGKIKSLDLLNSEEENLRKIADVLLKDDENIFGDIFKNNEKSQKNINLFFKIFKNKVDIFPKIKLINEIKDNVSKDKFLNFIKDFFSGILQKDKFISIFNYLKNLEIKTESDQNKENLMKAFYWYLSLLNSIEIDQAQEILKEIELKNEKGEWKTTKNLCVGLSDINKKYLLENKSKNFMNNIIFTSKFVEDYREFEKHNTKEDIINYLNNLSERTSPDLVGLFLCLFEKKDYESIADKHFFTNGRTVKKIREKINKSINDDINDSNNNRWDLFLAIKEYPIEIKIQDLKTISITSIVKNIFSIETKDVPIGDYLHIEKDNGIITLKPIFNQSKKIIEDAFHNTFFQILSNSFKDKPLIKLLKKDDLLTPIETKIFFPAYPKKTPEKTEKLWENLSKTDQLTIEQVKRKVENEMISVFRSLNIKYEKVENLFLLDDEKYENDLLDISKVAKIQKKIFNEIEELFKDNKFLECSLEAVKSKLSIYEYDEKSVIFELFQNADDAFLELLEMNIKPKEDKFVLDIEKNVITIKHWGRKINQDRGGIFSYEDNRKRRYNDDILKMLLMGYSRKTKNQTGKFGLGFKSIYLICEAPKILSGRLGFQILGALFPKELDKEDKSRLQKKLGQHYRDGTIFEIELLKEVKAEEITRDFEDFAYIQTCFSKKIRNIVINDVNYSNEIKPFLKVNEISKVRVDSNNYGLLFSLSGGKILFRLDKKGLVKFDKNIPQIWVTVPTLETNNLGFLVNAQFDIDVGRTQLAFNTENNYKITEKIAFDFYKKIEELYNISQNDFEKFKSALGLSNTTTNYDFWKSLFDILTFNRDEDNKSIDIAYKIMWGDKNSGYWGFIRDNKVIPNGFPKNYNNLLSLEDIKFKITGILLENDSELLNKFLVIYSEKLSNIKNRGITQKIFNKLPIQKDLKEHLIKIKLKNIIEMILNQDEYIIPCQANQLGKILNKEIWDKLQDAEKAEIDNYIQKLKFKTLTGKFRKSNELLNKNDEEESKIAAFAPDDYIIDKGYDENGIKFLELCRKKRSFDNIDIITNWALLADIEEKQNAVLEYILKGKFYRNEIIDYLKNNYSYSEWLRNLKKENFNSNLLKSFDDETKMEILSALHFLYDFIANNKQDNLDPSPKNNKIDWENLLDYWKLNKRIIIKNYENKIYPSFFNKDKLTDNYYVDEEVRKNWMILFLVGITHTFGLDNSSSNKQFLTFIEGNGLLSFFSNYEINNYEKTENWFKNFVDPIFEKNLNDNYRIWLNSLTDIYKISKYLSIYIQRFIDGLNYKGRSLDLIIQPRKDQDAYEDIPPLTSTLNMGANFVVRELVRFRNGNVVNKDIFKWCFVPKKEIRIKCLIDETAPLIGLVSKLHKIIYGNSINNHLFFYSKSIYEIIFKKIGEDNVTFDYCFDIAISSYLETMKK